jgi:adenine phosphoribosyltransferase
MTSTEIAERLRSSIRDVPDYPKPGILFKDISPLLSDPTLVGEILTSLVQQWKDKPVDAVAGIEARGFIFGSLLAHALGRPFVLVRKTGKLPYKTLTQEYALEYGTAAIEIHIDAIKPGWNVLVHDDLLATGGTAKATAELVERLGGRVAGFSFLIHLSFLPGFETLRKLYGMEPQYLVDF